MGRSWWDRNRAPNAAPPAPASDPSPASPGLQPAAPPVVEPVPVAPPAPAPTAGAIDQPIAPAVEFSAAVNAPVLVTLYKAGQPVQVTPDVVDDLLGLGYERMPMDLDALAEEYRVKAQAATEATAAMHAEIGDKGHISREADGALAAAERANAEWADVWLRLHYWTRQRYPTPEVGP